jgi:hypothetical protein
MEVACSSACPGRGERPDGTRGLSSLGTPFGLFPDPGKSYWIGYMSIMSPGSPFGAVSHIGLSPAVPHELAHD